MSYGLDFHPLVIAQHIRDATPPSRRKQRAPRYGWALTFVLLLLAASCVVFGGGFH